MIDFILAGVFFADVWKDREQFEFDDKTISVVNIDGLRKMKKAAGRPKDLIDLIHLNQTDV
ncbi:MAG: hypothetical protein ACJASX_001568 [Limisphaerales bacterium]|jgi:hypothetical protein